MPAARDPEAQSRNRCARWSAAICFFVVTVLTAASIGTLDWLSVRQSAQWTEGDRDPSPLTESWINNRTSLVYEQRFSVHGRVQERREFTFAWMTESRVVGHTACEQFTTWDVWWLSSEVGCSHKHQGNLDEYSIEWGDYVCAEICRMFNADAEGENATALSCDILEKYANEYNIADPAGPWNLLAICTAPKGIVAVLTLSMVMALLGVVFCFCCRTRPKLLLIPSFLSAFLAAIGPIGYGAAVANTYPWKALHMDEMLSVSVGGANAASSDVATVRSGFAVAIVASVTAFLGSLMLVYNLYFVRASRGDHGRELEVMSAVPVPVTDVLASRGEQVPDAAVPVRVQLAAGHLLGGSAAQDASREEEGTPQDLHETATRSDLPAPTAPAETSMTV